jgi:hypothetical protein
MKIKYTIYYDISFNAGTLECMYAVCKGIDF